MERKKYTLPSNILFVMKTMRRENPKMFIRIVLGIFARIAAPFTAIMLPKIVIDAVVQQVTPQEFVIKAGGFALILASLAFLQGYTDYTLNPGSEIGMTGSSLTAVMMAVKHIDMDYELLSDPEVKKLEDTASAAMNSNNSRYNNLLCYLANLSVQIGGLLLYSSIISTVHWLLIPLLALSVAVSWMMLYRAQRYEEKRREEIGATQSKIYYIIQALTDNALAKDLRLYSMTDWLGGNQHAIFNIFRKQTIETVTRETQARITSAAMVLIRDGAAYALLVYLFINGRVTLGDFALMFAAIGAFAGWLQGIISEFNNLRRASVQASDFRTYLDIPDHMNRGKGAPLPDFGKPPEIVFENVCYKYPGADNYALENINLTIKAGERLAVVGVNGAGKSTLVKLMCGLYSPTNGVIRLNGVNIAEFNRDEYYALFTAVFQEIWQNATTICGNVSQQPPENTDRERVEHCLKLSGLWDKVESLPNGLNTELVKEVDSEAIDLSGGEKQKLALARALYKNAPVIILDEPTAALDPIAENETYQRYAELTADKTSVYISHRLASTRFCDNIILLDNQTITERGTHDELLSLGGKYAGMFDVQAKYYRTGNREAGENE